MSNALFIKRRYHNVGNKPDETVESFLKKQRRWFQQTLAAGLSFGMLGIIGVVLSFIYDLSNSQTSATVLATCLILGLAFCFMVAIPLIAGSVQLLGSYRRCSNGHLGRWVITLRGIYHRFGKSTPRFVAWADVHSVRYNDRKNQIVIETGDVSLVIMRWLPDQECTRILPFLNKLLELLKPFQINTESLLSLQEKERKKLVVAQYSPVSEAINLLGLIVFYSTAAFSVGLLIVKLTHEYIRSLGVEPEHEISWFGVVLAWVLMPVAFVLWRKLKRFNRQKNDKIYQSLLSGETVKNGINQFPSKFEMPPRTLTAAARRRIRFTWLSMLGLVLALLWVIFAMCDALSSDENIAANLIFLFFAFISTLLTIYVWSAAGKIIRLLEQGVAVRGILRNIAANQIKVKLFDEYSETLELTSEKMLLQEMVGQSVTAFINPDNLKDAIIFENNVPAVISYDITTNTFDTDSKLPYFQLPLCILFAVAIVFFIYLILV
ncbi:MAG: hypothetical protein LBU65_16240 [Planctomycetaceae bacterium]|jgi:hypothetical protein|nr:hypothetical protein [Planctomycetaceae bacterium]